MIDLIDAHSICQQISTRPERPGEIVNNLGHMFVLLQAISILREKCFLAPTRCAPTQQSTHESVRITDLEGEGWALEAYGGLNVRNNSKLALDLQALCLMKRKFPRTFLAFRETASRRVSKVKDGGEAQLTATCPVRRGGPFNIQTTATVVGSRNGVVVLETGPIMVTDGARRA